MRLTKRQLKRIIREEYNRLKRRGLITEMGMVGDFEACVQQCFAAIPANMKQICKMGMAHMVTNDIYHICAPICEQMGCNCDEVSRRVEAMCCGTMAESRSRRSLLREYVDDIRDMVDQGMPKNKIFHKIKKQERDAGRYADFKEIYDIIDDVQRGRM